MAPSTTSRRDRRRGRPGIIIEKELPTPTTVRLRMHVEDRLRHRPGQHYLIRLRAPDDYTAQRSYSVASDDDDPLVEFLVERLPDGEVSEFLADVAEVGDVLEMRGPIGRWFPWDTRTPALCLVAGTGVVPAVAMLRAARRSAVPTSCRWSRSAATPRAAVRRRAGPSGALLAYTRQVHGPPTRGRADRRRAHATAGRGRAGVRLRLGAVRRVREPLLLECGVEPQAIRVERFGATG